MNSTCPVSDLSTFARSYNVSALALQSCIGSTPIGDRTIWNIIWSSLTTIVTCTWVAWHPNVPGLNETWLQKKARRIHVFVIALLAPEVVVLCVIRQFVAAREMGMKMQQYFKGQEIKVESIGVLSVFFSFELSQASFPIK